VVSVKDDDSAGPKFRFSRGVNEKEPDDLVEQENGRASSAEKHRSHGSRSKRESRSSSEQTSQRRRYIIFDVVCLLLINFFQVVATLQSRLKESVAQLVTSMQRNMMTKRIEVVVEVTVLKSILDITVIQVIHDMENEV
jgi:transposase-like protein